MTSLLTAVPEALRLSCCLLDIPATYTWGCYIHVTLLSKHPLSDDSRQLNWEFALKGGIVSWILIVTIILNLMFYMAVAIIGKV